nr:DUF6653 family protein [Pelagibacterium montanilacus]
MSILPLLALAIWSRVWIGWWMLIPFSVVLAWTWLNPRLFPPPESTENWMSKGVLGERIWLNRSKRPELLHHAPVIRTLTIATTIGTLLLLVGLALLDLALTTTGLAVAMLSKLWLLDRMVWIYGESGRNQAGSHDQTQN